MQTQVRTEGETARIQLAGRFDFSAHREFKRSYERPLDQHDVRELRIDLGGVEYLDSSALGMLLVLKERACAANKRVALTNCRGSIRRVLEIVDFSRMFPIV